MEPNPSKSELDQVSNNFEEQMDQSVIPQFLLDMSIAERVEFAKKFSDYAMSKNTPPIASAQTPLQELMQETFVPEHEGQYLEAVERMYISRIDELMRENGMLKLAVTTLQGTVAVLEGRAEPLPIYLYRPCSDCSKMEFMRTALICCAVVIGLLVGNQIIEAVLP